MSYHLSAKRWFLQTALAYLGTPYVWGGDDPSGFDCSGFVIECLKSAGLLNLKLPDPFVRFFQDTRFQEQIISNMECYFQLSENIYESPFGDGGFFIEFMHDGQELAIWNLYLHPDNWHRVVETPFQWERLPLKDFSLEEIFVRTHVCAPSFEEFIYRNWIENMIWFLSYKDLPLTKEMETYLEELKERKYNS